MSSNSVARFVKAICCISIASIAIYGQPVNAGSPPGDVVGKVTVGYQGWFSAPGDGSPVNNWGHDNIELWPDMREYTQSYSTSSLGWPTLGNGQGATMFSSYDQSTVNLHFSWMAQNGIDTAALQRFGNEIVPGSQLKAQRDGEAQRVMNAAQLTGRKFFIMYDLSGGATYVESDWTNTIVNTLHLSTSSAYAKQNGKPVVCLWGLGYTSINIDGPTAAAMINWFKSQGCYVIVGAPGSWRSLSGQTRSDYGSVWPLCNMIMPWQVGGGPDPSWMAADFAYCNANGIDYQSDVYPGFSFHNSNASSPPNQIPRNAGDFMWSQFALARQTGVPSVYISMFDEVNEGTAIFKGAEDSSMIPNNQWFLTLDADGTHVSSDFYLRLTDDGMKMVKGVTPYQSSKPTPYGSAYRIIGRQSGRVLDVVGQSTADGSGIDIWDWNGGTNQQWALKPYGAGVYELIGVQSGRALDVQGQGTANGTAVDIWDRNNGANQLWYIQPTDSGYFKIVGVQSGRVLEVKGQSTADGSGVDIWDWNGGANQQWGFDGQ
jgi:hypothetical protein